jgi:hypothetical protein
LAAAALANTVVTLALPANTPEVPQRMSLALALDPDQADARFLVDASMGPVPTSLISSGQLRAAPVNPHPWPGAFRSRVFEGRFPKRGKLERPRATVTTTGPDSVRVEVAGTKNAWAVNLHLPVAAQIANLRVDQQPATARNEWEWQVITMVTGPSRKAVFDVRFSGTPPTSAIVSEYALGFPDGFENLPKQRPSNTCASQFGDLTVRTRKVSLAQARAERGSD